LEKSMPVTRRHLLATALAASAFTPARAAAPSSIAIDYAYYNPVSLLLKKSGWLAGLGDNRRIGKPEFAPRDHRLVFCADFQC
jgi:hypothetical protein